MKQDFDTPQGLLTEKRICFLLHTYRSKKKYKFDRNINTLKVLKKTMCAKDHTGEVKTMKPHEQILRH